MILRLYLLLAVATNLVIDVEAIVQGIRADVNEHPFSVWIQYNGSLVCGGSLVDTRWVLTLATCMSESDMSLYTVVIGDRLTNKQDGEVTVSTDKVVKHPAYNETSGLNNVALVYLSGEVDISLDNIGLVSLMKKPLDDMEVQGGTGFLSAFGYKGVGRPSNSKQKLEVILQSDSKCSNSDGYNADLNICYQAQDSDGKACTGDEGSPIVSEIDGNWTQVGINLQGDCKKKRMTGIQVAAYFDWIMGTVAPTPKSKITLDDWFGGRYRTQSFSPDQWLQGEDAFYKKYGADLWMFDCTSDSWTQVIDGSEFGTYIYSLQLSADKKYALVGYAPRYDAALRVVLAWYWILDMNTKKLTDLEGPYGVDTQAVSWAPTGSALAFVQKGDIFLRKRALGRTLRVTNTGNELYFFSGLGGWLWGNINIIWSPDGRYFLYDSYNYTNVREYDLTYYGEPEEQYVHTVRRPYMKTGTAIPTATHNLYEVSSGETNTIDPPDVFNSTDYYIFGAIWQDNKNFSSSWMSRIQDYGVITLCNAQTRACKTNYETKPTTGPITTRFRGVIYDPSGNFIFVPLADTSTEAQHIHIAMINTKKETNDYKKKTTFVTTGMYDVETLVSYDPVNRVIYFIAFEEGDASIKRLYRTTINRKDPEFRKPVCMSCFGPGKCEWVSASFSYSSSYYFLNCLGPEVPTFTLMSTTSDYERVFESNDALREDLKNVDLPMDKFLRIPIDGNQTIAGRMLIPSSYAGASKTKNDSGGSDIKYDLVKYVYGGPDSQVVTKRFSIGLDHVLASSYNKVVGYSDGRGSMGRGEAWIHAIYRNLGTLEIDDTITAGRYFKNMDFVSDNAGIYGWSYGGFNTLMALQRAPDVYKCGVSLVPVTDWKYYHSSYTEAYMSTPEDNPDGYDFSTVARYAENFKRSRLLIMDATGDDNVHYQNTAQFTKELVRANVQYEMMAYTDSDHGISFAARHVREKIIDFMQNCLKLPPPSVEPKKKSFPKKSSESSWQYDYLWDNFESEKHSHRFQIPKF